GVQVPVAMQDILFCKHNYNLFKYFASHLCCLAIMAEDKQHALAIGYTKIMSVIFVSNMIANLFNSGSFFVPIGMNAISDVNIVLTFYKPIKLHIYIINIILLFIFVRSP
ncbi:hypothetical protein ACJX0J_026859, partial [Zea mays]